MLPETLELQTGTTGNDVLNGGEGSDFLSGGPAVQFGGTGQDTLNGNGGDDYLLAFNSSSSGGYTNNTYSGSLFDGGTGNDQLVVSGPVFFYGQIRSIEAIDLDSAWSGSYAYSSLETGPDLISQLPANTLISGTGTINFHMDSNLVLFDIRTNRFNEYTIGARPIFTFDGSNFQFAAGSSVRMIIHGTGGADTVAGTSHGDYIDSQGGNDSIDGGPGNDTVTGWENAPGYPQPNVLFNGGDGNDSLSGGAGSNTLFGGVGNDSILGNSAFNQVNGNQGDDIITGRSKVGDWLLGGQGNDAINASASTGANILNGNLGDDTVTAGSGSDTVRGGQGNDLIQAGAGNDLIFGDLGTNTITGGAGADTFRNAGGPNRDIITDFHRSEGDRIQVDPILTFTAQQSGEDVEVVISNGAQFVLQNVQLSSLTGDWIGH